MEWEDIEDNSDAQDMLGGHSHVGCWDILYPVPMTQGQSDCIMALIRFAVDSHITDGPGLRGYGFIEGPGPRPQAFFPGTLEWADRDGAVHTTAAEFYLGQNGDRPTGYDVIALVRGE